MSNVEYSNAIAQAERQLPGDKWNTNSTFGASNWSRHDRMWAVSQQMLGDIRPGLKSMPVTELINSLKKWRYDEDPPTFAYGSVAGYVYYAGNQAIIDEIKSRPKNELRVLRGLSSDKIKVYRGPQGYMTLLNEVIKYDILGEK